MIIQLSVCKNCLASYVPGIKVIIEGYKLLVDLRKVLAADLELIVNIQIYTIRS